jgi:hypothetical protein
MQKLEAAVAEELVGAVLGDELYYTEPFRPLQPSARAFAVARATLRLPRSSLPAGGRC